MSGPSGHASERFVVYPPPELAAVVRTAAVPDIPFASFAHALQPLTDEQGELVDWVLTAGVLDTAPARGASVGDYWEWRRCWEQRHWLGPVTNAAALVTHTRRLAGGTRGPLDDLLPMATLLAGADADVVVDDLDEALESVATARRLVTVAGGSGLGFIDDTPRRRPRPGLARTWWSADGDDLLAAAVNTRVVAGPAPSLTVVLESEQGQQSVTLHRVDFTGDDALLISEAGAEARISQSDARPLGWLVPGAIRWHVRAVPLSLVWGDLIDGLESALSVAAAHGGLMRLTTTSPLG
ncbi:MAG: hypothetical protein AB7Q42_16065 [Acidimicrobiia bacterium]